MRHGKAEAPVELVDSLAGWRLPSIVADASMADAESVLLVGHEPTLSELIGGGEGIDPPAAGQHREAETHRDSIRAPASNWNGC